MRFRWNNEWQQSLDVVDRQAAAAHERGHVVASKLSAREKREVMGEIAMFERREPCPEPLAEGMCQLDASNPKPDDRWNIAPVDLAVNSSLKND